MLPTLNKLGNQVQRIVLLLYLLY